MSELDDLEILRAACCVAGLDRASDEREVVLLRALARRAGVGSISLDAMITQAREDPGVFERQLQFLTNDADGVMKTLFRVAIADGRLDTDERIVLQFFADRLHVNQSRFDQILRAARDELERH